jgi:hypothetical protein
VTRDSAWWSHKVETTEYGTTVDFPYGDIIADLAAEEKAHAVTREALAESERLRVEAVEEAENAHALAEAYKKERDKLMSERGALMVVAEKNEDYEESIERARDEALLDVQQLHDAAVETEGKLEALTQERDDYKEYHDADKRWHDANLSDDRNAMTMESEKLQAIIARIESRRKA